MNRPELYKKSVDILFQAYFNDTLQHRNCAACAVGNLIAGNLGYKYIRKTTTDSQFVWITWEGREGETVEWGQIVGLGRLGTDLGYFQIASTGYTIEEAADIENAFERCNRGECKEDYMFNGLVGVLEVLKKIHEVDDNEEDVTRFRNHYQLKTA